MAVPAAAFGTSGDYLMSMKPSAAIRCADALHAMTGDCS